MHSYLYRKIVHISGSAGAGRLNVWKKNGAGQRRVIIIIMLIIRRKEMELWSYFHYIRKADEGVNW